jgi:hypothetical protein
VRYRSRPVGCLGPWSAQIPTGFPVSRGTRDPIPPAARPAVPDCHRLWCVVPDASGAAWQGGAGLAGPTDGLTTPMPQRLPPWHGIGLGSGPFRSPLLRAVYRFRRVLRCFSSPGVRPPSPDGGCPARLDGLPHSETTGSPAGCASPVLSLLACVLRRLVVPRHPPTAQSVLPGLRSSSATIHLKLFV